MSSNRGDKAIRQSIADMIQSRVNVPIAFFSCKHDVLTEHRIKQLNKEASMLLIGGSGLYTNYPSESGWYFPCKTRNFQKIKVPIVLFGIGSNNHIEKDRFGPLTSEALESIKKLNEKAVLTGVRDYRTLNILKDSGINNVCLTPDPSMFLNAPVNSTVKGSMMGLSIAQHCVFLQEHRHLLLKLFSRVCERFSRLFTPVFVNHDCLEHNLYTDLKKKVNPLLYYDTDNPYELMNFYNQLSWSIGVRCHSNIMSFGAGTPFISLIYDRKQIEFLKLIGFPQLGIRINSNLTFTTIAEKLCWLHKNLGSIKLKFKEKKHELKKINDNFVDKIVEVLECI
jgi:polysaccharide pyruvyl transferase WcaK-like protein